MFLLLVLAQAVVAQQPLNLTCMGGGTANRDTAATGFGNSYHYGMVGTTPYSGNSYGAGTIFGTRSVVYQDQVDVHLFSGDDRIRLPRTILPQVHGGRDGWFRLKDVVADARSIRAKAALNLITNPKVYIDRVTGTISISGRTGDFSGQCQVVASDAPPKF